MSGWLIFSRVARLPLLPALLVPILWGTTLAWWQTSAFNPWLMGLLLLLSVALSLVVNLLGHYLDYRRSMHPDAIIVDRSEGEMRRYGLSDELVIDGYRCLVEGFVRPGAVRSLAYIALIVAVFTIIWLGLLGGWPLWFFGAAQLLLIAIFLLPPVRYGRRWWIADDLGLLVALGILPSLSAFYAPTGNLSQLAVFASLTPALLVWLAFQSYAFYSWHRDWKLRKRTMVVILGPRRALDVSTAIGLLAFVSTILLVALNYLPVWSLFVLGALPTFLRAFARGHHETIMRSETLQAINLSAIAAVLAGLLSIGALWIAG
ncbi:MAG: prenyltransferase [Caldilineaceae bacterium]|nr:prenyltransferase [Caldilineaceae bacterium]